MSSRHDRLRADLALAAVALVWGSTFVIVKDALADVSTLLFLTLRFTVAAVALAVFFRRQIWSAPEPFPLRLGAGAVAGILLFSGYVFQTMGLRLVQASQSAFITGLYVVMVPVLGALIYRKRPHLSEIAGVLVSTVGMGLLTVPDFRRGIGRGDLLTFGCSVSFALHLLALSGYGRRVGYATLSFGQVAVAAALGWASFWWAEEARVRWSASVIFAVLVTSILATAVAFTVFSWAQRHTTATRTALVSALEPVFAWLTSFVVAGELLSAKAATGAALILAGILLVELKPIGGGSHPSP